MPLRVALDPRVASLPPDLLAFYEELWTRAHVDPNGKATVYCNARDERLRVLDKAALLFPQMTGRWSWQFGEGGSIGVYETLYFLEDPEPRLKVRFV